MNSVEIKKFMNQCLIGMMVNGKLSDDGFLSTLGSIVNVLEFNGTITKEQRKECIVEFFNVYNSGTAEPMSEIYIEETLVPHILNLRPIELREAHFYIDNALDFSK